MKIPTVYIAALLLSVFFQTNCIAQSAVDNNSIRYFLSGGQASGANTNSRHFSEPRYITVTSDKSRIVYSPVNTTLVDTFTNGDYRILRLKVNRKISIILWGLDFEFEKGKKIKKGDTLGTVKLFPLDKEFTLYCAVIRKKKAIMGADAIRYLQSLP